MQGLKNISVILLHFAHLFVPLRRQKKKKTMNVWQYMSFILISLISQTVCMAQPQYHEARYDEEDGVPSNHVTQLLQDDDGFMWFSTWNGLCRFDGYEFQTFKALSGDSCHMTTDRLRNIWLSDQGNIYCKVDNDTFLFDTHTYRYYDIASQTEKEKARETGRHTAKRGHYNGEYFELTDRQGLNWNLRDNAIYCLRPIRFPAQPIAQHQPAQIRCLARDGEGRIWITSREDATVRLFDAKLHPMGYLRPNGRLQANYASFGHPVYCITQTRDGLIWLGSKPGGLFRYDSQSQTIRHIGHLPHQAIYDIKEDRQGRIWLASLGGGLICMEGDKVHQFMDSLNVRYIHLTDDNILLATTTNGVIAGRLADKTQDIRFRLHQREANRRSSLNCNATMDILQDRQGRLFVSTESEGISEILSKNLLADTLSFRHLPMRGGWPTETVLSMANMEADDEIMLTGSNLLIAYNPKQGDGSTYDSWFFHHPYHFSEVRPLRLDDGRWLFGSMEGAFTLSMKDMKRDPYVPDIVLTAVTVHNCPTLYAVNHLDTLWLSPSERSLTIQFAALDFSNTQRIRYEFRIGDDHVPWNPIGHNHSVTLSALQPGTYELWLRSTNADGISVNNLRRLVIIARPTFWESIWGQLLIAVIVMGIVCIIAYTLLYIRRIKHKQHETLQAYLALMEKNDEMKQVQQKQETSATDDPVIKRVMEFIEQNISNSDASVGDMAEAAATSRSGLQRKLKKAMGITPLDLLREARIKHACRLLHETDKTVAEISYASGFTDPKYFSRCFKQSIGKTPSEFKSES